MADQRRELLKERYPQMSWLARTLASSGVSLPIRVPWGKVLARSGLLAAAVAVAVAGVYVIFWPVSDLIARHDVGAITGRGYGAALQQARDAARGRLVAFGAGLFAAGALIYTARNFSLTRQGQVTDRYTKAIEQLGSDKGIDVRVGGVYALERIAHDSPRDHPTIMDVLATFIRDHSSEPWPPVEEAGRVPHQERATRPDIQAALTVIGRRDPRHDRRWSGRVDLHSAVLGRADLRSADLGSADLSGAVLVGANLSGAYLSGANLEGAYLNGAFLTDADLTDANLEGAQLRGAHLSGAYLSGANLIGVPDFTDVQGWPEKEIPVPHGWILDKDSDRLLKRAGELSEVTVHYL